MSAGGDHANGDHAGRIARRLNLVLWAGYLLWMTWSVLVVIDPTGIGGIEEPDGLEGVPLVLGLVALPFVVTASVLLFLVPRWRARNSGGPAHRGNGSRS